MEDLREAVGALDHYLDAAEVVRKATPANVPAAWASPEKRAVSVEREPAPAPRDVTGQQPAFPPFRDQTTGLHTRAGFEAIAGGALKRCARHAHPFALLMVRLSATPVSDLRTAGMITQSGLRASDCVAAEHPRTLLIGLPETSTEAARSVGERLVAALQTGEFRDMDLRLGLANRSVDGETLESLIGAAHSRLTPAAGAAP
jgi:GGDEF domain-containing protein